jgi:hypothetical protein
MPASRNSKKLTDTVHTRGTKIVCPPGNSGIRAAHYQKSPGREVLGASVIQNGVYAARRPDFPGLLHGHERTKA